MPVSLTLETIPTPIGDMLLTADADGFLRAADFVGCEARLSRLLDRRLGDGGYVLAGGAVPTAISGALRDYFAGSIAAIDGIAVKSGGTPFQQDVWQALRAIPPGSPLAYGRLSDQLGRPRSPRAVGHANGANPICVVVPCHRLVGADGALTGYSGGTDRKRWLLDHEARHTPSI
ncbi:methylated-DNA--[protein]-cysteine S-methyltransferase [Kaistia granuli]|uniref:methylated-DNA--[protein]-cysteine S-methyltransferase n=1 Tax=Kaistia granuli TaxID=363259 RepID=UPI00036124F5|nr:methylated-DNA--[protein]-cysteine S-methyltransferase [Kaistia granuli]